MGIVVNDVTNKATLLSFLEHVAKEAKNLPEEAVYKFTFNLEPVHVKADQDLSKIVENWNQSDIIIPNNQIVGATNVPKKNR